MKPKQPPPLIIPKDKPYHFTGWRWKNGKWTPTFQERLKVKRKRLTQDELVKILKAATVIESQKQVAENIGTSPEHLNRVLKGQFDISPEFAEKLGYRRIVLFEENK